MTAAPTEDGCEIAPMTARDVVEVGDLFDDATADGGGHGWAGDAIMSALERGGRGRVARTAKGAVLGAALALPAGDDFEIVNVAVAVSARGRGLGRRLLAALLEDMRQSGAARCVLEARSDNATALALYVRLGFQRIGVRPGYYRRSNTKIDAYVFAFELNG